MRHLKKKLTYMIRPVGSASVATAVIVLHLQVAPVASGQDAAPGTREDNASAPATQNTDERIRFRSLEIYEQKDALAGVLRRMATARDDRREEARTLASLSAMAKDVPRQASDDERTLTCIKLQNRVSDLKRSLRESYLNCLAVLDTIQQQAVSPELSTDGAKLLRESERELRAMMAQQQKDSNRVRRLESHVRRLIKAIPPPRSFVNRSQITMIRIGKTDSAFYVSESPISVEHYREFLQSSAAPAAAAEWEAHAKNQDEGPATFVTWGGANRFCRWLSEHEKQVYALPSAGQCSMLKARGSMPAVATWLGNVWTPADYVMRRELRRFAVDFFGIWDPAGNLAQDEDLFGELPFARYSQLGFYIVTDANTGLRHRWQRLKATIQ